MYVTYNDETKPNVKPHYQVQEGGNCFAQAPIQVHRILQLVHDPSLKKENAYLVNFSLCIHNLYEGKELLEYTVDDEGDTFETVLNKIFVGDYDLSPNYGDLQFAEYVEKLQKHHASPKTRSVMQ